LHQEKEETDYAKLEQQHQELAKQIRTHESEQTKIPQDALSVGL